jgi:hypothetical protein
MSIVFTSTVDIAATPDQVWEVLVDFASYGEWSNFRSIEGDAREGARLTIRMPGMTFRPTVTAASPRERLEWSAKIVSPRFFLGQHRFTLTPANDGTTRVTNSETFSGVSVAPFRRLFANSHSDNGYTGFNQALKARVEARASSIDD